MLSLFQKRRCKKMQQSLWRCNLLRKLYLMCFCQVLFFCKFFSCFQRALCIPVHEGKLHSVCKKLLTIFCKNILSNNAKKWLTYARLLRISLFRKVQLEIAFCWEIRDSRGTRTADNEDRAYGLSKRYRSRGRVHDNWTDYAAVGRTEEKQHIMGAFYTINSEGKFTLPQIYGKRCLTLSRVVYSLCGDSASLDMALNWPRASPQGLAVEVCLQYLLRILRSV